MCVKDLIKCFKDVTAKGFVKVDTSGVDVSLQTAEGVQEVVNMVHCDWQAGKLMKIVLSHK